MVLGFRMKLFLHGYYDVLLLKNVNHLNIAFQLILLFNFDKKGWILRKFLNTSANAEVTRQKQPVISMLRLERDLLMNAPCDFG
jgi:hypothetical protein